MHTCGGIQHTASSSSQSKRLFLYNLNTLSSSTVTDELLTKTCSGVTVFFAFIGQGPNRRRLIQKHSTTWQITWQTEERSQSFLSLNLVAWRTARWYIGQVNSSQQDWLMALRRYAKTSVHTSAPGVTRTPQAYVHYSVFTVYECTGCSKKNKNLLAGPYFILTIFWSVFCFPSFMLFVRSYWRINIHIT